MTSDSIRAKYDFGYEEAKYDIIGSIIKSGMAGIICGLLMTVGYSIFKGTPGASMASSSKYD
jgi:hypothetical protein